MPPLTIVIAKRKGNPSHDPSTIVYHEKSNGKRVSQRVAYEKEEAMKNFTIRAAVSGGFKINILRGNIFLYCLS